MKQFFVVFGLVAAMAPARAGAQVPGGAAQAADPARFSTEIVVTPERGETPRARVPAATVVLEGAALHTLPAVHLGELISFLPGFSIDGAAFHVGRPVLSARGFFGGGEAEYVLLLVDGVPASDVESGLIDWSSVPTASIRRIEGLRGPGASLYGDSAIGGVIQVFTDRAVNEGQLSITGGSFGTASLDGGFARSRDAVTVTLSAAARRTEGGFEHSGTRQAVAHGSVDGGNDGFSWRWTGGGVVRTREDPGALAQTTIRRRARESDDVHRFDGLDRRSVSTALTMRHGGAAGRAQGRVYLSGRDEEAIRTVLLAPGLGDRRERSLATVAFGANVEAEHVVGAARPLLLRLGVDLSREHLDTGYRTVTAEGVTGAVNGVAVGHRVRAGAFASASWDPLRPVRLSGGVRWDDVDDGDFKLPEGVSQQRAWSPRASVVVQLNEAGTMSLFSQVSRAFKAPTLDQRFDPRPFPDFRGGSFTISNAALVPQRALNLEAGLSGGAGPLRWSALAYRMAVEDEIDFDLRTFRYANIGTSRHTGLELEVGAPQWSRLRPSVSYTLSRVGEPDGRRQLKNIPRHRVGVGMDADLPGAVGVLARYHHSRGGFLDDRNVYPIDGPSALDLRVRRHVGRHTIFLDVINLTDDVSEEYGFTLTDFSGRVVPYAYPGAPRALRAGMALAF